jgi:acetyltransferase-like isoleucine patch superfamily enzyme
LIGSEVTICDSAFHDLSAAQRRGGRPSKAAVRIADNVFIGDRVLILKGVHIGADSVIGAGSISIPAGIIATGTASQWLPRLAR